MKIDLFKQSKTANLSLEQIQKLNTSRLKAYRKKLIAVISANSFCDCCGEPLKLLYSNDDYTHIDEVEKVLDMVNKEFAQRSRGVIQ